MRTRAHTQPMPIVRLPRMVAGEWRCRDCGRLSYGKADEPRCPTCFSLRLMPTLAPEAEAEARHAAH